MRKIEVVEWTEKDAEGKDVTQNTGGFIEFLVGIIDPRNSPKGLEKFETFSKLSQAIEDSKGKAHIFIEEREYALLKGVVLRDLPSQLGYVPGIVEAVKAITDAEKVDLTGLQEGKKK